VRIGRFLFLVLAAAAALSCATSSPGGPEAPPLAGARLAEVRGLIDTGAVLQAFQDIALLRRDNPSKVALADIDALEAQAASAFSAALEKADADSKWDDALRYIDSARALGRTDLAGLRAPNAVLAAKAAVQEAAGDRLPALLTRLRALSAADPTEADLAAALGVAASLGNRALVRDLSARMTALGFSPPPTAAESAAPFADMLEGTVTIWVNRGIRIEKGVGYPDRVIGSGFFVDPRGYLLTNYHVIKSEVDPAYEGYSRLFVMFNQSTGEKIPAKVVGWDTVFDLALLKAEVPARYSFGGAASQRVAPGDRVFAIGSPAGLEKTITSGIVSATGRRFLEMGDAVQVDVPLNPGNSGGPLISESGDLIGIVFAGLEQFEGLNFAVPYLWIERSLPLLYGGGEAVHPWMGAALSETEKGLEVVYVLPGEPAARAGLAPGDFLDSINGVRVSTLRDAQEAVLSFAPPTLVRVALRRAGAAVEAVVCLAARPRGPIETALKKDTREAVLYPLFGMRLERTGGPLRRNDFMVRRVIRGSTADEAGLSENDPLTIQDWKVDSEKGFAVLQLYVKKRKAGFIESVVQIAAYLETPNFL
jgi:serine protease Do